MYFQKSMFFGILFARLGSCLQTFDLLSFAFMDVVIYFNVIIYDQFLYLAETKIWLFLLLIVNQQKMLYVHIWITTSFSLLFICLSFYLFMCPSVCLSMYVTIYLSVYICLWRFIYLSFYSNESICLSYLCNLLDLLFICISVYLFIFVH